MLLLGLLLFMNKRHLAVTKRQWQGTYCRRGISNWQQAWRRQDPVISLPMSNFYVTETGPKMNDHTFDFCVDIWSQNAGKVQFFVHQYGPIRGQCCILMWTEAGHQKVKPWDGIQTDLDAEVRGNMALPLGPTDWRGVAEKVRLGMWQSRPKIRGSDFYADKQGRKSGNKNDPFWPI